MLSPQSHLTKETDPRSVRNAHSTESASLVFQQRKKVAQQALSRLNRILGGVIPFVILRMRIRGSHQPFQLSALPLPIHAVCRSGDLLLDFPCDFKDDSDEGIARNGGRIILKVLGELEKSGIDIGDCSIFFIP
ncbi:MAG: hypothetical protein ACXACI_17480 [Candidatus Hodarchaeales archaeon]